MAPVEPALSEPAKSIKLIEDYFSVEGVPSASKNFCVKVIVETVWALEEVAFIFVEPIALFDVPNSIYVSISS